MTDTRIVVVAYDMFARDGIRAILAKDPSFKVVGEAAGLAAARALCERTEPSVFVVDITGLRPNGTDILRQLRYDDGVMSIPVVLLAPEQFRSELDLLRWGACAVVRSRTSATELVAVIRLVAAGYVPVERGLARRLAHNVAEIETKGSVVAHGLTRREREVFHLLVQGMSNAEIADTLKVASSTVKSHVQDLLRKLRLRNRLEAVIYAYRAIIYDDQPIIRNPALEVAAAKVG